MGRQSRTKAEKKNAPVPVPVQLNEVEFFRLKSLIQDVALAHAQAQAALTKAQAHVNAVSQVRNAYMAELAKKYPTFLMDVVYAQEADTLTLRPVSPEELAAARAAEAKQS
jgi:protoporphyrinogen oxidase